MDKKKLIIDCDCGSDDAMAIAMALNDPRYEIMFFTIVSGNVHATQGAINTLTTIEASGSYEPPVYIGTTEPILKPLVYAHETHGADGMGDIGLVPHRLKVAEGNGIFKMIEALRNEPEGTVEIVALGPLTNIAVAMRVDPEAMRRVKRISIMGTSGLGPGNVSPVAEFNIWQDAEAAKMVLEFGVELLFVGWDACLGDAMLNAQEIKELRESCSLGQFSVDCNKCLMEMNEGRFGEPCLDMADPAAMAAALYEECIEDCEKYYCEIDVSNGPSYGGMLVDVNFFSGKEPNAWVCSKLKPREYKDYIFNTINKKFGV